MADAFYSVLGKNISFHAFQPAVRTLCRMRTSAPEVPSAKATCAHSHSLVPQTAALVTEVHRFVSQVEAQIFV